MEKRILKTVSLIVCVTMLVGVASNANAQRRKSRTAKRVERKINDRTVKTNTGVSIKGDISHSRWEGDTRTMVSFDEFPTTLQEWKTMQQKLGGEPQGAVALQVMAFELYRNNRTDGEAALRLNNTSTNYNSTVERLREIMGKDAYYARPYIARAMLSGARPENGYTVRPPYTIEMKVDPNKRYQESQLLKGTVIYLLIFSEGWDTNWRNVEVVKPAGSDYYVVSNCPAMYTQCKEAKK